MSAIRPAFARPPRTAPDPAPGLRRAAVALAVLGALFFLRVIGQVLVTWADADWLPALEHWQSGLLPYPALLASQIAILTVMVAIVRDLWRGQGRFAAPRARFGRAVRWFGVLYLASMLVRYAITMAVRPEWRWFGHSIPIVFHCLLATCLLIYSGVLLRRTRAPFNPTYRRGNQR